MIKRIRFADALSADREGFAAAWRETLTADLAAPPPARPLRVVMCTALTDETPQTPHHGIGIEWYDDADHLARHEDWLASADPVPGNGSGAVALGPVVVAEEHVMRGADWLERRWSDGGPRWKHMAIARRAAGLTPAQFIEMWRGRAGKVGATPIPDVAKGCAYAQNHPLAALADDPSYDAYDAVNEVWFDDLDALRTRVRYMADALSTGAEDDLVGERWLVAFREEPLS